MDNSLTSLPLCSGAREHKHMKISVKKLAETFAATGWCLHISTTWVLEMKNVRLHSRCIESEPAFRCDNQMVHIQIRFGKHWKSFS